MNLFWRITSARLPRNAVQPCRAIRPFITSFSKDESGSILVIGLMFFFLMIAFSGMSLDLIRYEMTRSKIQGTADRAVLSAASVSQQLTPEAVVTDYFTKENLLPYLEPVTEGATGLNFRTVTAAANVNLPSLFMNFVGVDSLTASAISTATEKVTNVEVSLVLDISGSMNSNNKLQLLKDAAVEFVHTVLTEDQAALSGSQKVAVSLVPYAAQVNAGRPLLTQFEVENWQESSFCVDFTMDDFNSAAIDTVNPLNGAGHFDPYGGSSSNPTPSDFYCPTPANNKGAEIVALSGDIDGLTTKIQSMTANGYTSIDLGLKWGTALLDPSMQSAVSGLITDGEVSSDFQGRPAQYKANNMMKVIILMTDGENVAHIAMKDQYKSGPSNIWANQNDTTYKTFSMYDANKNKYFWRNDNQWHDVPYGNEDVATYTTESYCRRYYSNGTCRYWGTRTVIDGSTTQNNARRLNYEDLWTRATVYWVGRYLFAEAYYRDATSSTKNSVANSFVNDRVYTVSAATKDKHLSDVCAAARNTGVVIFTVAFEAGQNGKNVLRDCASSDGNYFDVAGLEISTAFRAIARQISYLRLTQ
jgi:hypothetical protein